MALEPSHHDYVTVIIQWRYYGSPMPSITTRLLSQPQPEVENVRVFTAADRSVSHRLW